MARRVLPPIATALALAIGLAFIQVAPAQKDPISDYLDAHNAVREEVGIEALTWDSTLADYAQGYADERAGDCDLVHSDGPYGENIFWGMGEQTPTAYDAVDMWAREKQYYDYESNSCELGKVCGHYTQLVWADTKRVGCGRVKCYDGSHFIVCSYDPPGNEGGQWPYAISA